MKKSKFSEKKIISIIKEGDTGAIVADVITGAVGIFGTTWIEFAATDAATTRGTTNC